MAANKKPQIIDLSKLNLEQLTGLKNQLDQVSFIHTIVPLHFVSNIQSNIDFGKILTKILGL